jgi:hypothetical protein
MTAIYITQSRTLNNRAIMQPDTEQDIVLAPAAYWEHFLYHKSDDFCYKKNRLVRSEDTNVVVQGMYSGIFVYNI